MASRVTGGATDSIAAGPIDDEQHGSRKYYSVDSKARRSLFPNAFDPVARCSVPVRVTPVQVGVSKPTAAAMISFCFRQLDDVRRDR
ncbi:hypothetical protein EBZ39_02590 [bacterium]|nr:hypothetical protein [bacterium]